MSLITKLLPRRKPHLPRLIPDRIAGWYIVHCHCGHYLATSCPDLALRDRNRHIERTTPQ